MMMGDGNSQSILLDFATHILVSLGIIIIILLFKQIIIKLNKIKMLNK